MGILHIPREEKDMFADEKGSCLDIEKASHLYPWGLIQRPSALRLFIPRAAVMPVGGVGCFLWLDRIAGYLQYNRSILGRRLKSHLTGRISIDSWLDILNPRLRELLLWRAGRTNVRCHGPACTDDCGINMHPRGYFLSRRLYK